MLESAGSTTPDGFELEQNYPNPFNPETRIRFTLPVDGDMRLQIYNSAGQMVRSLADGTHRAGIYDVTWDGKDTTLATTLPAARISTIWKCPQPALP